MNVTSVIGLGRPYWTSCTANSFLSGTTRVLFNMNDWSNYNMNGTGSQCRIMLDGVPNINNDQTDGSAVNAPLPFIYQPYTNTIATIFHNSSTEDDYYRGMSIQLWNVTNLLTDLTTIKPVTSSIITSYKGAYNQGANMRRGGYYYCDLDCSVLESSIDINNAWTIGYGGGFDVSNNHVLGFTSLYINGGSKVNNHYKDYYIEDVDLDPAITSMVVGVHTVSQGIVRRMKKISSYDGTICRATLAVDENGIAGFTDASGAGFQTGNKFRIRIEKPLVMGWGCVEPTSGPHPRTGASTGPPPTLLPPLL